MRLKIWCGPLRRTLSIASRTYSVVNRKFSLHPESFRLTMRQKTSPVCTCRQIWRLVLKICQSQEIVLTIALRQHFYRQKDRHPVPVLLFIYAQRKKDGIRELCATKQCQCAMRLFYHYLPCLACHGDLYSGKAPYAAEFIPDVRLLIGGN